jgi:hypothetical protein
MFFAWKIHMATAAQEESMNISTVTGFAGVGTISASPASSESTPQRQDSFIQDKRPTWVPYSRSGSDNIYNNAVLRSFKAARSELGISDEDLSAGRYSDYALRTSFYKHLSLII